MKKIIIAIIIILVVFVLVRSNKNSENPVDKNPTATTSEQLSPISIGELNINNGSYSANIASSSLNWTGRKVLLKDWIDTGTIGLKEVTFEVQENAIISNKFVIDMTTIKGVKTGKGDSEDMLTNHLKSDDFFDVEQFPTATFVAQEFSIGSTTGSFVATGDLTIKGITNEVSIPVMFDVSNPQLISIKGSVDIDRTLWDVRYGSGKFFKELGDNVIDDMFNLSFDIKLSPEVETETDTETEAELE